MKRNCAISTDSSCTQIIMSNDDHGLSKFAISAP